jgi:hypothetical protein
MSPSSGVGYGVSGRGIVGRRGGRGGRGIGHAGLGGHGGVLEDPLPLCLGLHFHHEITLPMGDPGRVSRGNIGTEINLLYIELFFISHGKSVILVTYIIIVGLNNIRWLRDIIGYMNGTPPIVQAEHVDEHMERVYISFTVPAQYVDYVQLPVGAPHPMVAIAIVGKTSPIRLTRERTAIENCLQ